MELLALIKITLNKIFIHYLICILKNLLKVIMTEEYKIYKLTILLNAEKNNWLIRKEDTNTFFIVKKKNKETKVFEDLEKLVKQPYNLKEVFKKLK